MRQMPQSQHIRKNTDESGSERHQDGNNSTSRISSMKLTQNIILIIVVLFLSDCSWNANSIRPEITPFELEAHVQYLSSDDLGGRKPGSDGDWWASKYISETLKNSGIALWNEDGFQSFPVTISVEAGTGNRLKFEKFLGVPGEDFIPLSFSANAGLSAPVVYAGYGFDFQLDSLSHNDYGDSDVTGKWVMVLRGDPDLENQNSPYLNFNSLRDKVLTARDNGAGGVLFVSGPNFDETDDLLILNPRDSERPVNIPVIHIKRRVADKILSGDNVSITELEERANAFQPDQTFEIGTEISGTAAVKINTADTHNIIGILEGSDPGLKDQYIIVGAHYDHLGLGGPGSGSRRPDLTEIHNGADDNASGVAAVLELAQWLAIQQADLKRSVVFIFFGAEEMGVLGSKYFVNNPPLDLDLAQIMFNLDMIGSYFPDSTTLLIGGSGTAVGLHDQVEALADSHGLKLKITPEGYGPSDHSSFYAKDIPVLSFFTGAHDRYHTPEDDYQYLNYAGEKQVVDFAHDLITDFANRTDQLVFQEAGPKEQPSGRRRFKVALGIMPDHAADVDGLRVEVVIPNRPGALAGLENGDVIIGLDGKPVGDIYEYMHRLAELKTGQRTSIEVMRGGEKLILIADF